MINSVRIRLTLWYTGLLAFTLLIFAFASWFFLLYTMQQHTDETLSQLAIVFKPIIDNENEDIEDIEDGKSKNITENKDFTGQTLSEKTISKAIEEEVDQLKLKDYQIFIFDPTQNLIVSSKPTQIEHTRQLTTQALTNILHDFSTTINHTNSAQNYNTLVIGAEEFRVLTKNFRIQEQSYTLLIAYSLYEQKKLLANVRIFLFVAIPFALMLASIGGYLLARKSLLPVVTMSRKALYISAANLHERLPVYNPHDELGSLANTFNDLLSRLDESFAQQRGFMADASHELRTPIAIICGETEVVLSKTNRTMEDYQESLAIVKDEGRRLTCIVEDLFILARADAGQLPLRLTNFYFDELASECIRAIRTLAAKKELFLECEATEEMPIYGDENLLQRMILNLLDNAIKYTPKGGSIKIKCAKENNCYVLTVTDTGIGIPLKEQPYIFNRFYRVDKVRSRQIDNNNSSSGVGLGLSIARWIAEAHQGKLQLLHSNEQGSTFIATLPYIQ